MGEVHEVRKVMNLLPLGRFFLFPVLSELFNAWLVCGNGFVTAHAFAGGWDTSNFTPPRVSVAVHAVYAIYLNVDVVRKFDGLFDIIAVVLTDGWLDVITGKQPRGYN